MKIRALFLLTIPIFIINFNNLSAEEKQKPSKDLVYFDYSKKNKNVEQTVQSKLAALMKPKKYKSKSILKLAELGLGEKEAKELKSYEVRFLDNSSDYTQDYSTGEVRLEENLNIGHGIRSIKLVKDGYVPTYYDLVVENNYLLNNILTLKIKTYNEILSREKVELGAASVLVELDDYTEDVEISTYEKKIFLDEKFKKVDSKDEEYFFIMFLGVKAGNNVINYKSGVSESYSKIIYNERASLYFDSNFFSKSKVKLVKFTRKNLLGENTKYPRVDKDEIKFFSRANQFKKISQNSIKLQNNKVPLGSRLYFEINKNEKIYFGTWNKAKIEIPSYEFIDYIEKKISRNNKDCVVQLNLSKKLKEIDYSGRSAGGYMYLEDYSLDKDGRLYSDVGTETDKVFFKGEGNGVINIKMEYVDGSKDFLQSYCSVGSYLVETI